MDKNPISKLSFGLFRSKNLEEVSINNSEIAKLPWWFAYKKKISKLYIYNNPMLLSKQNINRMHNITHLQISVMDNDSMPEYFSELVNITKLVIYKSKINRLPKSFYKLSNLEVFILYKNEFTEIPEVCFKLKSLKHLDFYYNKIRYIPMGIIQCNKLEELYLSFNQISVIPDALQEMKNLKRLYIHHNNIEEVPEWINNLYNLEVLDMGYNGISELPSLMELTKLHTVDFQSNSIFKFPLELLDMQSLNRVFLFDNPFEFNIEEGKLFEQKYDSFKQRGGELFID